jgi:DNA-binding MarR family transcriptional regulator
MVDDFVRRKGYLTLGSRMRRLGERLQAEVQMLMDDRNVPIQANQYPLLGALEQYGPLLVGDLAETLGVSQPGITRNVAQLSKQGLVTVRQGKDDQRQRVVALTARGRSLVENSRAELWPQVEGWLADIMAGQTGPLLEQLDHLEATIKAHPLSGSQVKSGRRHNNG